jgi:hypothetical protein
MNSAISASLLNSRCVGARGLTVGSVFVSCLLYGKGDKKHCHYVDDAGARLSLGLLTVKAEGDL